MTTIEEEEFLPGTSRLVESLTRDTDDTTHLLKHGDIILSPQPTRSPNDPLNWSIPRKYWHGILLCFVTGLTAATSNDAGSAQDGMNADLDISYNSMNTGAGVLFVGIGYFTLLISPAAWLYGRRITYLVCMVLGIAGAIWMARVQSTEDSIWNQLFVGASEACAEANVQLSLSEIFFQHQRGSMLGVYVLSTSIGTYLGPLIAGFVADRLGWRWIGWLSVIISSCTFLVLFFGLEETLFDRSAYDTGVIVDGVQEVSDAHQGSDNEKGGQSLGKTTSDTAQARAAAEKPKTYRQRIQLITLARNVKGTGFKQYYTRLFHTFRIFAFPAVIYSGIQWGAQDAWLTFYLTLEEDNWYGPPWNYGDVGTGLMNIPCLIGAVIGCFWGGYLSDRFVLWYSKKFRNGIREAEDRLWMMFPCAIFSPAGMLVFGLGTAYGWSWARPYVGLGLIGFGWGCAGDLSMAYLMDAYPEMVLEGMITNGWPRILLLLSLISSATALPEESILKLSYQSKGIQFTDWVSLFTLCLTPLVVHVIAGTPQVVCLPNTRKHLNWQHRFCQYNPTTILWRYFAIADRRIRAKTWSAPDMAASNVVFWTARGWDGSEEMIQKTRLYLIKVPDHARVTIFSKSFVQTVVITIQGIQAIYVLAGGFVSASNAVFVQNIALDTIFSSLAVLGLVRLLAAFWLTDDFFYDEHEDRSGTPAPSPSPLEQPQTPKPGSQTRPYGFEPRSLSSMGLFEPADAVLELRFHSMDGWRGRFVRFIFLALILVFWGLCFAYMFPWGAKTVYESPTLLLVNIFYLFFLSVTLVTYIYYFIRGGSATTIIPCIVSTWYQIYTGVLILMTLVLILVSSLETRKTMCGSYTTWPIRFTHNDALACKGLYVSPNSTIEAFGLALRTTSPTNDSLLPQGQYRISDWDGLCMGREGANRYVFAANQSVDSSSTSFG